MSTLKQFRDQNPEYNDMPDQELAERLHSKFYSDIPKQEFMFRLGVTPKEQPRDTFMGAVDAGIRGAADMLTFGFADEIAAGLETGFGTWGNYGKVLARERGIDKQDEAVNPYARMTGQIAGGVAQGVGAARMAAPYVMGKGAAIATGSGVAGGAAYGGAYGFGSGEGGVENRVINTIPNAAIGAAGGAIGVAVGKGAGALARRYKGGKLAQNMLDQIGMGKDSARTVRRALMNDGATPNNITPDGMIADVSPSARQMLDGALQRGGDTVADARAAIEQRAAGANARMGAAMDTAFGTPQGGVEAVRTGIRKGTAGARKSAYDAAYSRAIDYASPEGRAIENLVKSRVPGSAIRKANELMRAEGVKSGQILARIADDGTVESFERLPDVRQLDYIKRALGDVAAEADGKGKLGGTTAVGRAYGDLARELRDLVGDAVPEYRTALDVASDAISESNAVKFGGDLLRRATTRGEVAREMAGMTKAERGMVKQGVREYLDDTLANVRRTITDGNTDAREAMQAVRELSSRASREKVAAVIGKTEADKFFSVMDEQIKALDLRASVARNSATYGRMAFNEALEDIAAPGPVRTLIERGERGGVMEGIKATIRSALGGLNNTARQDKVVGEIANVLTKPRGREAQRVMTVLLKAGVKADEAARIAQQVSAQIGGGAIGGSTAFGASVAN